MNEGRREESISVEPLLPSCHAYQAQQVAAEEPDNGEAQDGPLPAWTRIIAPVVGQIIQLIDELEHVVGQLFQRGWWL